MPWLDAGELLNICRRPGTRRRRILVAFPGRLCFRADGALGVNVSYSLAVTPFSPNES